MTAPVAVEVRDAATVLLVRDGQKGLEVAMLRRRLESVFARGAYVFPGGAVDGEDRDVRWADRSAGHDDAWASSVLGTSSGGLAFWVAAVRECFEEAGVLLARRTDGQPLSLAEPAEADHYQRYRAGVDGGLVDLFDVCAAEDLHLPVGDLHYFAHWITPEHAPRRYDTRFFLTRAPDHQTLSHDGSETIAALWLRPAEALDRNAAGDFELIYPTLRSLEVLTDYPDADAVLSAASAEPLGLEPTP